MNRLSKALCGAFFLACLPLAAFAGGSQPIAVTSTTFVDLGAAPVSLQATGYPVTIVTADTLPTSGTLGNTLLADGVAHLFQPSTASSHVYAAMLDKPTTVIATPVSVDNVAVNPVRQNGTPRSGSVTVGGAWQMLAAANPNRRRLVVQNPCDQVDQGISATENLYIGLATEPTSTHGTWGIVPCGTYESGEQTVGIGAVWVMGATSGHFFTATEW